MKRIPAEIAVGDEAWCFFAEQVGKGDSRHITGVGRCRVVAIDGDTYRGLLLRASNSHDVWLGREREFRRGDLYAVKDRAEHLAFGTAVSAFWPSRDVSPEKRERALAMATGVESPDEKFQLELWRALGGGA